MNKNSVCIIAILFLALPIAAQEVKSPLEKLLWESVSPCYENFYEDDESEHSDIEIINDAKNGFLHVSGTYPTCGCYCSATVGVYRDKNGDYVILQKLEDTCNWQQITSTNTTLTNILPEGFGILNFMDDAMTNANTGHPLFYVDIGIPRHGTVTKLELKLIPFGLQPKQEGLLTYGYSQNDSRLKSFGGLLQLVQKLKSLNVLDPMLQNDFSKLIPEDNELIDLSLIHI